jgi:cytochrome bd ubiquinol oxidase subunit I
VALNMGFMKSNSRVPYTVYNQSEYTVEPGPPPTGFGR